MPALDWSYLAADAVLGFGAWILMTLITISLVVWFAYSILENTAKMWRWIRRQNYYDALLRENERLRDSLMDAQEENDYLRKLYRDLPPRAEDEGRNAA